MVRRFPLASYFVLAYALTWWLALAYGAAALGVVLVAGPRCPGVSLPATLT
jgi:hypothetical protein